MRPCRDRELCLLLRVRDTYALRNRSDRTHFRVDNVNSIGLLNFYVGQTLNKLGPRLLLQQPCVKFLPSGTVPSNFIEQREDPAETRQHGPNVPIADCNPCV